MFTIAMRTVFVGCPTQQITAILTRLGRVGFGSYAVDSLREGRDLIEGGGFDLVLSVENVEDGNGYDLASPVMKACGSLFVGVETCVGYLWLPVIDHGEKVLGSGAMDYGLLELELVDVLTHRSARAKVLSRWVPPAPPKMLEGAPRAMSASLAVAKEARKRRQITTMAVPVGSLRSLRFSAAKAVENRPAGRADQEALPGELAK
jgi:hypothetical protein